MPLALAALLATTSTTGALATLPSCSWNQPGHDPFMGDVVAAVDRYQDIPAPVRARLKARMAVRAYDEIVSIRRDGIEGRARYGAEIRDMHFGAGQVCGTVNRASWTTAAQERGLVYCEADHCILVPTVCRNVSRITRLAPAPEQPPGEVAAGAGGKGGTGGETGDVAAAAAGPVPESAGAGTAPALPLTPGPAAAPGSWIAAIGVGEVQAALPGSDNDSGGNAWPLQAHYAPGSGTPMSDSGGLPWRPSLPTGLDTGQGPGPITAVPEPGTWALMFGGLALVAWRRRRRAASLNPA